MKRVLAKLTWPFLRHQIVVNAAVLDALSGLQASTPRLDLLVADLDARLDGLARRVDPLDSAERIAEVSVDAARLSALEHAIGVVGKTLEGAIARVELLETFRIDAEETLQHHHKVLVRHEAPLEDHEKRLALIPAQFDRLRDEDALLADRIELAAMQAFSRHHDGVSSLQSQLAEVAAYVDENLQQLSNEVLADRAAGIERAADLERALSTALASEGSALAARLEAMRSAIEGELDTLRRTSGAQYDALRGSFEGELETLRRTSGAQYDALRGSFGRELGQLQRSLGELRLRVASIDLALGQLGGSAATEPSQSSHPSEGATDLAGVLASPFARLYDGFVDATEPSRAQRRLSAERYLGELATASEVGRVLDLGCGDGWLLEMLRDAGVDAYGVEVRPHLVEMSRARGTDVRLEGAAEHLAGCAKDSLGAITMLHLVEYLDVDGLVQLLDLALLALHPGGLLVVETLDPANIVVASTVFPSDPMRRWLVPKELLSYLLEARGFCKPELRTAGAPATLLVAPDPDRVPWSPDVAPLVETINEHLLGPDSYLLVGRRE